MSRKTTWVLLGLLAAGAALGCDDSAGWSCVIDEEDPDFSQKIGCREDYDKLSSTPVSASISGARSVKVVIDRADDNNVYFQNSVRYPIHWNFASTHLSGNGLPVVPMLGDFNVSEYYSPDRRFLLGALNYYEGPQVWAYEIAPYDTATADMIEAAFRLVKKNAYIGKDLYFHPTSDAVATEAEKLPDSVPVITTDELFEGIDYQALNLGVSKGQLRFLRAEDLDTEYLTFRDIVVLDSVPNDISVCMGIITEEFQTPLSHLNVLSQNRGTPNMALKGAFTNEDLRALEGEWVRFEVGPFEFTVEKISKAEADQWWDENKPDEVGVPAMDLTVTDLRDYEYLLDLNRFTLGQALDGAIPAFGGKASHYGAFAWMDPEIVPHPKAFAVPIFYYQQFMEQNGFDEEVAQMLEDADFCDDPAVREARLDQLRDDMRAAPVDPGFEQALLDKLEADYPGIRMRFRSSTNAEDLDGFTGAGLYVSKSGDPDDPLFPVMDAVREVWSAVWFFRAFEEREYRSIDHQSVGMALLVHHSFPFEEANGVAMTANIFDSQGLEPGYYVNTQIEDYSVVLPDPGVTSDQFILHYEMPGQPIVYIDHSNLVPAGESVLTRAQILELGAALWEINDFFKKTYGPFTPDHFYAMDVEFKFDDDWGGDSDLWIKQARPYPGWGG